MLHLIGTHLFFLPFLQDSPPPIIPDLSLPSGHYHSSAGTQHMHLISYRWSISSHYPSARRRLLVPLGPWPTVNKGCVHSEMPTTVIQITDVCCSCAIFLTQPVLRSVVRRRVWRTSANRTNPAIRKVEILRIAGFPVLADLHQIRSPATLHNTGSG